MLSIRTQDRMTLVPYRNQIKIDNGFRLKMLYNNEELDVVLGKYSTKERALEVLDEIEERIEYVQHKIEIMVNETKKIIPKGATIYQMPLE